MNNNAINVRSHREPYGNHKKTNGQTPQEHHWSRVRQTIRQPCGNIKQSDNPRGRLDTTAKPYPNQQHHRKSV